MAAPVWRSQTGSFGSSTGTTIATPSGTVSGDFLLLHISFEGGTNITVTHSAFTLWDREDNSSNIGHVIAYREHDGTSLGSFSLNSSQKWSYTISRIDGQDGTPATAAHKVAGANGASGNPDPPSITTTINECLVFAICANKKAATYTAPSGYTERWDRPNTDGGLPSNWGGAKTVTTAGAENPAAVTASETEVWVAGTVAIAPASSGGETASAAPVVATFTVAATTATYQAVINASASPVISTFTVAATTATYVQVETASASPVTGTFTVPAVTAVGSVVVTASAAPVTSTFSVAETTATYQAVISASASPVVGNFTVASVTATYVQVETASATPVVATFSVPATTATYIQVATADASPVTATFSVPSTSATYVQVETASVAPVTATFSVPSVSANYAALISASVAAVSMTAAIPEVTATSDEEEPSTPPAFISGGGKTRKVPTAKARRKHTTLLGVS